MNLQELRKQARVLSRDSGKYMFTDTMINGFINEGIDRLKQTIVFHDMEHLDADADEPDILPAAYHYILALYASARCMEYDERHYEAMDRRNEFETLLSQLISDIEASRVEDEEAEEETYLTNKTYADVVTDVYFCRRQDLR